MELKKWVTNNGKLQNLKLNTVLGPIDNTLTVDFPGSNTLMDLGVAWNPSVDVFGFNPASSVAAARNCTNIAPDDDLSASLLRCSTLSDTSARLSCRSRSFIRSCG